MNVPPIAALILAIAFAAFAAIFAVFNWKGGRTQ